MDSPRSERIETRFSTPVSDLDDHRNRVAHTPLTPVNVTFQGMGDASRDREGGQEPGSQLRETTIARDFEHAIDDDEGEEPASAVEDSSAPKRNKSRRMPHIEDMSRPREGSSTSSSRSTSPPNSIDAFAEPRRRERANTFGSKGLPDLDELMQRTVSGGTHRRRPTFSSDNKFKVDDNEHSGSGEDDFVNERPKRTYSSRIDFEAIEEFVAESRRGRPSTGSRHRYSFSSQGIIPGVNDISAGLNRLNEAALQKLESAGALDPEKAPKESDNSIAYKPNKSDVNRFSFFSSDIEQTIHAPELGDIVMPGESFRDLFELPTENGAWWLDITDPTKDEMSLFQKAFEIHPLTTEDIHQKDTREKVELFNNYYFVCFRSFNDNKSSDDYLEPINVYMVVFREGILTFCSNPTPHAGQVRQRIGKFKNYDSLTADWICYAMVDSIVDFFFPSIREIEIETDQIEDQVFVARADDFASLLRQIGECRKKVMSLMRVLGGKADVIKGFSKRCNAQYSVTPRGDIGLYLSDIQDHIVTMMSNLGHFEKMLSRSHSNYLAQLSVDNLAQGTRANEVLSKITIVATVIVPLNVICGLFGMNVPVPGGVVEGSLAWFGGIIGVMVFIVLLSLIIAKRFRFI